jgi:hypothetical protein
VRQPLARNQKNRTRALSRVDVDDARDGAEGYLVAIKGDEPPLIPQVPHAEGLAGTRHSVYSLKKEEIIERRRQCLGRIAYQQPRHPLTTGGMVGCEGQTDREFKIANGALLVHSDKLSCAPAPLAEKRGKCRQGYSDALNALHVCDLKRPKDTSAPLCPFPSPPPSPYLSTNSCKEDEDARTRGKRCEQCPWAWALSNGHAQREEGCGMLAEKHKMAQQGR